MCRKERLVADVAPLEWFYKPTPCQFSTLKGVGDHVSDERQTGIVVITPIVCE